MNVVYVKSITTVCLFLLVGVTCACRTPEHPEPCPSIPIRRPELSEGRRPELPASWFPEFPEPAPVIPASAAEGFSPLEITREDALADIELYFSILRYAYAGYGYFGGDAAFLEAKAASMAAVREVADGDITKAVIENAVAGSLRFVEDVHSTIGDRRYKRDRVVAMDEALSFELDDGAYYLKDGEARRKVLSILGVNPSLYIRPSIDKAGRLVYRLAGLFLAEMPGCDRREGVVRVSMELAASSGSVETIEIGLRILPSVKTPAGPIFSQYTIGSAAALRIASLYASDRAQERELGDFVEAGAVHAGDEALVIDARANGGGNDNYVYGFFEGLAGTAPEANLLFRDRRSSAIGPLATESAEANAFDDADELERESYLLERFVLPAKVGSDWSALIIDEPSLVRRERGLLVVLADRGTASSAETLVQSARLIEGSLLVGTPTSGCANFGCVLSYRLPRTGIGIAVPVSRSVFAYPVVEGEGFEPDLWVPPYEAATRLEAFMDRYGAASIRAALDVRPADPS